MTKVTIIGQDISLTPIDFIGYIDKDSDCSYVALCFDQRQKEASSWENIELIAKNYMVSESISLDLMFAYNSDRNEGVLYFGSFNDGIV